MLGDERLVEQIRRGNELAFEVAFERHGGAILGFCRHMLGSREEAEDAVQHTFAAAFNDLQRGGERQIALKPWLYTIARNRCLSVLRARREPTAELEEIPTEGLHEQVERRAELRELLGDLRELPEEQRAALLLAEAADLSHAEVAGVLGCEVARVKALVFRARSGLIERREARETPCADIREQLANLRGGSLRRSELRHHLRHCPGCSEYREQVRRQRQMFAVALPVVPSLGSEVERAVCGRDRWRRRGRRRRGRGRWRRGRRGGRRWRRHGARRGTRIRGCGEGRARGGARGQRGRGGRGRGRACEWVRSGRTGGRPAPE